MSNLHPTFNKISRLSIHCYALCTSNQYKIYIKNHSHEHQTNKKIKGTTSIQRKIIQRGYVKLMMHIFPLNIIQNKLYICICKRVEREMRITDKQIGGITWRINTNSISFDTWGLFTYYNTGRILRENLYLHPEFCSVRISKYSN